MLLQDRIQKSPLAFVAVLKNRSSNLAWNTTAVRLVLISVRQLASEADFDLLT